MYPTDQRKTVLSSIVSEEAKLASENNNTLNKVKEMKKTAQDKQDAEEAKRQRLAKKKADRQLN